jgi:adenylate kinase
VLPPAPRDEVLLVPDYEFFQLGAPIGDSPGLKLQGAAINDLGFEWHAQGGMLAAMPSVVQEFRTARGLQPLRLLVHGNDDSAKELLAAALADEYKLPLINASGAIAELTAKEDELGDDLKAAQAAGIVPDELVAKALASVMNSTTCRNQGYVLQGFPATLAQAGMLFGGIVEGDGDETPPEGEANEGEGGTKPTAATPEFVITLEADEETLKEKLLAQASPTMTEERLSEVIAEYATNNAEDSATSILALATMSEVEQLGPLEVRTDTSMDAIMSKARVYIGQPRNYGPSDEEMAAKRSLEEAEVKRIADEAAAADEARGAAEDAERKRREEQKLRRAAEVQQQEQELLEVRSVPLRNYLMQNVIPTLTEGLIEVCKLKPEDPVDYLAEYLFKNNPIEDEAFE